MKQSEDFIQNSIFYSFKFCYASQIEFEIPIADVSNRNAINNSTTTCCANFSYSARFVRTTQKKNGPFEKIRKQLLVHVIITQNAMADGDKPRATFGLLHVMQYVMCLVPAGLSIKK